jgi:aryl-alcohol dehydrogenase-like predicted oxidoreductase
MGMSFAYGPANEAESLAVLRRYFELGGNFLDTAEIYGPGCTPSQLAFAWILAKGKDIVPIPGTKRLKYLEENMEAVRVNLNENDLVEIDKEFRQVPVHGDRYSPDMMRLID